MSVTTPKVGPSSCDTLRERIIAQGDALFHERGYSKVSALEIACALGISKKTLYKEFETKEDILRAVVQPKLAASARETDRILSDPALDYLGRLRAVMAHIGKQYQKVSTVLVRDVFAHAPVVSAEITAHRQAQYEKFAALLKQGVAEHVFRPEINADVVITLFRTAIASMMNPTTLMELPCTATQTYEMLVTILLEGVVCESARETRSAQRKAPNSTGTQRTSRVRKNSKVRN